MQPHILPSRSALVDRVAMQFEYGQNLICLAGSSGLGKSYLAETFITDKYPEFNKAFIKVTPTLSDDTIIMQLLVHSFRSPLVDQALTLSENFYHLCKQEACGPCLWVFDSAKNLSEELIGQLVTLSQHSPNTLYILLTGQPAKQIDKALEIYLEPLSLKESRQLMGMFFNDLPVTEDPIFSTFLQEAGGNPAILLAWDKGKYQIDLRGKSAPKHSIWLPVCVTLLMACLMFAFFYKKELNDYLPIISDTSYLETVVQAKAIITTSDQILPASDEKDENSELHKVESNKQKSTQINNNNVDSVLFALNIHRKDLNNITLPQSQNTEKRLVNDIKSVPSNVSQEVIEKHNHAVVEQRNTGKLHRDQSVWFLNQPDNKWVIQLLAAKDYRVVEDFLARHALSDIKIYKMTRNSANWWVVVHGVFPNIQEAQKAKKTLSRQLLKEQPFLKQLSKIKAEVQSRPK